MILIRNIDVIDVREDIYEIMDLKLDSPVYNNSKFSETTVMASQEVQKEIIKGNQYLTPDGKEFVIGCTGIAADALKIQLNAHYEMINNLKYKDNEIFLLEREIEKLNKIKSIGFFKRLKFLFTKKVILLALLFCITMLYFDIR